MNFDSTATDEEFEGVAKPRPFRLEVPQSRLDWIARRVADAHIGYAPSDDIGWKYGTDAAYLAEVRDYWRDLYEWRKAEASFNAFPQFVADIEGIAIHFYHVRGAAGATGDNYPVIFSHGWPGSVLEFLEVIPLMTARGYDVVVPSLPGYGFSGRPDKPISRTDIARIWRILMTDVLGYQRFGAQGGDWGAPITYTLAQQHSDVVGAYHLNLLHVRPGPHSTPEEVEWRRQSANFLAVEGAYSHQQMTKPQTIGLALADSPIGFASWVLEKYRSWADCDGNIEKAFSKDELITSIMTYIVSDNVQAAMWLYYSLQTVEPVSERIPVPMGFSGFKEQVAPPPRAAAERVFNVVHWTEMPRGGHFAAWEEPALFAQEVASFFDRWR